MSTELYRVPKRRLPIEILTPHGDTEAVFVFVSNTSEHHIGCQRPSELLNDPEAFLVVERREGEIAFVNRDHLVTISMDVEDELEADPAAPSIDELATDVQIVITLDTGDRIEGTAHYQLPEANRRIQDFLNTTSRFLPVRQEGRLVFVNRNRITEVLQR